MSKNSPNSAERLGRLYQEQAQDDLKLAAKAYKKKDFGQTILLATQAASNELCAWLVQQKMYQTPSYQTSELLKRCLAFEPRLAALEPQAQVLDGAHEMLFFTDSQKQERPITAEIAKTFLDNAAVLVTTSVGYRNDR